VDKIQILKKEMAQMGKSINQVASEMKKKTGKYISSNSLRRLIKGSKPKHETTKMLIDYGFTEQAAFDPSQLVEIKKE
jgi:hypothetical protein